MNKKPIEQARNPLLSKILPAIDRVALRARKVASQTGTAIIVMQDGHLQRIQPNGIREPRTDYQTGNEE